MKLTVRQMPCDDLYRDTVRIPKKYRRTSDGEEFEVGSICKITVTSFGTSRFLAVRGKKTDSPIICMDEVTRAKLRVKVGDECDVGIHRCRFMGYIWWAWSASDPNNRIPFRVAAASLMVGLLSFFGALIQTACSQKPMAAGLPSVSGQQGEEDWTRMAECSAQADKIWSRLNEDANSLSHRVESHYSRALSRCFVFIERVPKELNTRPDSLIVFENLYDGFEGTTLAYRIHVDGSEASRHNVSCMLYKRPWLRGTEEDKVDCAVYQDFVEARMADAPTKPVK
jgi:hypothetical protein